MDVKKGQDPNLEKKESIRIHRHVHHAGCNALRDNAGAVLLASAAYGCSTGDTQGASPSPDKQTVRLAYNESPFGPPPAVHGAMEEMLSRPYAMDSPNPDFLPGINRYPGFLNTLPTDWVAGRHKISTRYVIVCCGISELLYMCSQAFLGPDRHLLMPELTYLLPEHYALEKGCEVRKAPMDSTHGIDLNALLERITPHTGLVYLANPNNPTGSLLSFDELENFVRQASSKSGGTVILIDEAYMDYVRESPLPEAVSLVKQFPVLVGRTFSKAFGMAGLRAGYVIGNADLVIDLNGFLSGYLGGNPGWRQFEGDVNRLAIAAMRAGLSDKGLAFVADVREQNALLRDDLVQGLQGFGFESLPSHANFLMVSEGSDGENLRRYLYASNFLVQAGGSFHSGYQNWVRVSVGNREEIDSFLETLKGYNPTTTYPSCPQIFYHGI